MLIDFSNIGIETEKLDRHNEGPRAEVQLGDEEVIQFDHQQTNATLNTRAQMGSNTNTYEYKRRPSGSGL